MRKLSKKVRLEKALQEAEAHVREWGTADLDYWVDNYAFNWGFEDDQAVIASITQVMMATDQAIQAEKTKVEAELEESERLRLQEQTKLQQEEWNSYVAKYPILSGRSPDDPAVGIRAVRRAQKPKSKLEYLLKLYLEGKF